jgi:hypothetical protein
VAFEGQPAALAASYKIIGVAGFRQGEPKIVADRWWKRQKSGTVSVNYNP